MHGEIKRPPLTLKIARKIHRDKSPASIISKTDSAGVKFNSSILKLGKVSYEYRGSEGESKKIRGEAGVDCEGEASDQIDC